MVDRVCEVFDIAPDQIQPPPGIPGMNTGLIQGIGTVGSLVVLMLDLERVIELEEVGPPMPVDADASITTNDPPQQEAA